MRIYLSTLSLALGLALAPSFSFAETGNPAPVEKEWTFLVYLNGNNNLDSYGSMNINQMEKIGSTADVNVVVQWASLANHGTKRLLVKKDSNPSKVTSPIVQDLGAADMGDWRTLVEFIKWGAQNYPARHYFVNVWDHGSGWHALRIHGSGIGISPSDISWDDNTGHFITTEQLGQAIREASAAINHRIDVYGSDACLMAMNEVADEMSDVVDVFVGSEEVEPAEGWPYDQFLKGLTDKPTQTAQDVGKLLTEEYSKAYSGGQYGNRQVTFSAFDLGKMPKMSQAITSLGEGLQKLGSGDRAKVVQAVGNTTNFTYSDYGDLGDFIGQVEKARVGLREGLYSEVRGAINEFVIANRVSSSYSNAKGVAMWLPGSKYTYNQYSARYSKLRFNAGTKWADALRYVLQDAN